MLYIWWGIAKLRNNMGLFNFSNLIQPENSTQSQPLKSRISDPSFRDLVRDAVKKHEEKIPVAQAVNPTEEIEIAPVVVPMIPSPEKVEEIRPAILPTREVKSEINHAENQTYGTFFLKTMLTEFSDLLAAGNELEAQRNGVSGVDAEKGELDEEYNKQKEARNEVAKKLTNLFTIENDNPELLTEALSAYNNYLASFENTYNKKFARLSNDKDEFGKKISKKKMEIELLMKKIGSPSVFNEIKKVVSFCKDQRAKTDRESRSINEVVRGDISKFVTTFVEKDLSGAVMLAQGNDLIGLMMRIYNAPQK